MIGILPLWVAPFGVGFALSFSLILAIGAQNAFVLRQGLMRQHIGALVLFCALSDAILIVVGVGGVAPFMVQWLTAVEQWLFAGAALWLWVYGLMRGFDAWRGHRALQAGAAAQNGLMTTLAMAALVTFGNPHVYLDTTVLIGTVSLQYEGAAKIAFAIGATTASFVFFAGLGYGAAKLSGIMQRQNAWRILDAAVAVVMLVLAFSMARAGDWL
jgi:L-lysine exporter family protein LysE/ArgO